MTTPSSESIPTLRSRIPLWVQIIIWVALFSLLTVLAASLFRVQIPMIEIGQEVPEFTVPLYEGYGYDGSAELVFSSLRGKVVLINFWASWCVPCEDEASLMEESWRFYQPSGEVVFIGIDYVDTPANGMEYLDRFAISYPNGPDLQGRISPIFNRDMGVPETFVVDRQGVLRAIKIGPFTSVEEIQVILDPLLVEK